VDGGDVVVLPRVRLEELLLKWIRSVLAGAGSASIAPPPSCAGAQTVLDSNTHPMCTEIFMKQLRSPSAERTNIVLDSKLVERVKRLANVKTTRDAVHVALEHYVRSRDYSGVLALRGTGGVSEGYDPKAASPPR
jgi:Arc/MetJ family transcription regulator